MNHHQRCAVCKLTGAHRVRHRYDTKNRLTEVIGIRNQITRYTISNGQLTEITDAEGHTRRYAWTADRVTKYTDAEGQDTTYVYDYDRNKREFYVRVTHPQTEAGTRILEDRYDSELVK
jgi:YD repeat-containing protein